MKPLQCIIGTAGHIDHGKTSLVKALTGTDCDRFIEEKERGITIDLGYARLELSDGKVVGLVDVPGHQRFVHNMLAGAAGIDLALMVIAADDSVMPQTVEHLAILELLGVTRGVVALTKADLVDEETMELAQMEVAELIESSCLSGSKIMVCSSVTGAGIDELRAELEQLSIATQARREAGFFRMPIDRVFTVKGHGVVVTGTVFSGSVKPDEHVMVAPGDREARIRRIQSHGATLDSAEAGTRAALNITGVAKENLQRGMVVCHPSIAAAHKQFTAEVVCHTSSPLKIVHNRSYLLHIHTSERLAKVYLMSEKSLAPGDKSVAQIRFDEPFQLMRGDRFVLRSSSARHTLGGGVVLEPGGAPIGRRKMKSLDEKWSALHETDSGVLAIVRDHPWGCPVDYITELFNLPGSSMKSALKRLKSTVATFEWKGGEYLYMKENGAAIQKSILEAVTKFHKENPAMQGIEESALAAAALPGAGEKLAGYWIRRAISSGKLEYQGSSIKLPGRKAKFGGEDEKLRAMILNAYKSAGIKSPPKTDKLHKKLEIPKGECMKMIRMLVQAGDLVTLAPDYTLHADVLENARQELLAELEKTGSIETARYRDILGAGRKAAIDILEYFDSAGLTKRVDNKRILARS